MTPPEELLDDVKNYLNITWTDDATDNKVRGIVSSGMYYLNSKAGEEMDYLTNGFPRILLFEYARYARDEALDVFENNYLSMILAMQNERRVETYVQSAKQAKT